MPFDRGSTQWTLWRERKALLKRTAQLREVVRKRDEERAAHSRPGTWWLRVVALGRSVAPWKAPPFGRLDGAGENSAPLSRDGRS